MSFTPQSRTMIDLIIPYMDKFIKQKRSRKEKDKLDSILKIFYFAIKSSYKYYDKLDKQNLIHKRILSSTKHTAIYNRSIFKSSKYVPESIKKNIETTIQHTLHISFEAFDKPINIYIGLRSTSEVENYNSYIEKMICALYVLHSLGDPKCKYPLDIIFIPLEDKKQLPSNNLQIISPINVNSAITTNCNPSGNSILIYRKEEWFKVFIHELFHSLNLDYSHLDTSTLHTKLNDTFNIDANINSYEAYTECWATLINCLFCSYELMDDDDTKEEFILYFELCVNFERVFSILQLIKVLNYMNLSYNDLITTKTNLGKLLFKQNTNVFSYYILKTIYLVHYNSFMEWCYFKNYPNAIAFKPTNQNIDKLFTFIKHHSNTKVLDDYIFEVGQFYRKLHQSNKKIKNKKERDYMYNTMRMTICELD